jgi:hypothetical protein
MDAGKVCPLEAPVQTAPFAIVILDGLMTDWAVAVPGENKADVKAAVTAVAIIARLRQ